MIGKISGLVPRGRGVNGQVRVAAGGQVKVSIPWLVSVDGVVSSCPVPGLAHPERLAFGDHDDAVVQEPVQQADGGGVLRQEPAPGNWDWLRFLIGVLPFDLLVSASGVSA